MGGKPRKKPRSQLTFDDLISGYDLIETGAEIWKVTRYLLPEHKTKEFGMKIVRGSYQRLTRGPNKGGSRMTLVVEYIDDRDEDENGR
jgi:hypothetical protein